MLVTTCHNLLLLNFTLSLEVCWKTNVWSELGFARQFYKALVSYSRVSRCEEIYNLDANVQLHGRPPQTWVQANSHKRVALELLGAQVLQSPGESIPKEVHEVARAEQRRGPHGEPKDVAEPENRKHR